MLRGVSQTKLPQNEMFFNSNNEKLIGKMSLLDNWAVIYVVISPCVCVCVGESCGLKGKEKVCVNPRLRLFN